MNEKVYHTLEYDKITAELAAYAGSDPAKAMCERLRPSGNIEWIEKAQSETAAAFDRILQNESISFGANADLRSLTKTAKIGRTLQSGDLLVIARVLELVAEVKEYGEEKEGDVLEGYFASLDPLVTLTKEIRRCIIAEDEIADDASSALKEIRRSYQAISGRIHSQLNQMVNGSYNKYLMDNLITMRNGRYCLPVKAEYKSQVPGMIHDQSSSGSTLFIEPARIVEMNNQLRELELKEEEEIERILAGLSGRVAAVGDIINEDQKTITLLDFIFAKGKYAMALNATRPIYEPDGGRIRLRQARHPLLDQKLAVPIDVSLGEEYDLLIVTGPNTGGKTVSLKTVGVLTLMGQSGLHIPALDRSVLSVFTEVFADIGDEQSIEQSLSTFSSHMTSIVRILKKADPSCLCLFDELGAGTDPTEGAALAISILEYLHERGIRTMATTHYSELKIFALSEKGVENACCEFDVESLRPTYRLLTGIPGKSNAFAISKKLGLPETIIERAGEHISSEQESFEDVISDLEKKRIALEKDREAYEKDAQTLAERLAEVERRENEVRAKKEKLLTDAREEARDILKEAKDVADETIRAFHKQGGQMKIQTMEQKRSNVREQINRQEEALTKQKFEDLHPLDQMRIKAQGLSEPEAVPGTYVHIISMDVDGKIVGKPERNGTISVQSGILTMKVRLKDLYRIDPPKEEEKPKSTRKVPKQKSKAATISSEINVIGMTVDDAVAAVDKYLDDAYLSHLTSVRIVHGKGTGALRNGIHAFLRSCSYVSGFELAQHGEGDAGVTVVRF